MLDFRDQPWFHSMETEASGRIVVYVKYMDKEVLTSVPDTIDGKQVVVHFAGAKLATREMFTNNPSMRTSFVASLDQSPDVGFDESDVDVALLIDELEKLERRCSSGQLADIFFEIKDQHNAVTDLSKIYPDVRKSLEKLYDVYGFDILYDELEL